MDDDKGLELSLGLPCGGSSSNSKDRSSNSADGRADTDERTSKIVNDFKNFLNAGIPQTLERIPALGEKRKTMFEETSNHKKQETETRSSDLQDKGKTSHISITTDEGSTADNGDVADSEAEGSSSRIVSHREYGSKAPVRNNSFSQISKEIHDKVNIGSSHFSIQPPMNTLNVPYSIAIRESPYSPIQPPVVNKDSPWGIVARPQALHSLYAGRTVSTSVPTQVTNPSPSEAARPDTRSSELSKEQTKQPVTEEGSSSQPEDDANGRANSFPSEYPSITPGIASEVKFGGSGSFPNLPWVSTTGPGSNGKTISGVTYKYNATQIKIVCACHGTHMSPDEFVCHAAEEQQPSAVTVTNPGLALLPNNNHAASARS